MVTCLKRKVDSFLFVGRYHSQSAWSYKALQTFSPGLDIKKKKRKSTSFGTHCAVTGCQESEYKIVDGEKVKTDRSFFQFLSDRSKFIIWWCSLIKREHGTDKDTVAKSSVICDLHNQNFITAMTGAVLLLVQLCLKEIFQLNQYIVPI